MEMEGGESSLVTRPARPTNLHTALHKAPWAGINQKICYWNRPATPGRGEAGRGAAYPEQALLLTV